ncbi:MAG: CRP/FNR family cyclic AMP-dependent transcriptional regulator [Paracoccaceae bacterium]|jgi:CRP/FNR family cyclic AMP-dependent transcriptional regulator
MAVPPEMLDDITLVADLPREAKVTLAQRCTMRTYSQAQEIISKENDARDVYFITSGSARVVNWSAGGREVSFEDIPSGGMFGELAAIDGAPRSATVVALETTEVCGIEAAAFMAAVLSSPETSRRLMERMTAIIRRSTGRIFDLSVYGANIRIYADLLRLSTPATDGGNSAAIMPIPVHSDIAARVSTTRETVARVLGDLSRREIVIREKDRLIVPDTDRLAEMVED